ncbi:hypothetical protein MHN00_11830 [Alteromonas sp. Cnat2-8]|uniref:hypothetical protein n=1 Tax=Alteromonas sp. Cnat2-8 TaxID=2917728 RepID=UPI001EF44169|nr:hypothetical protein [Alteromonas sp. Cnat2-8]MCG7654246.1 hypothetical protein [Alteromonas sp. Cnat2-8]
MKIRIYIIHAIFIEYFNFRFTAFAPMPRYMGKPIKKAVFYELLVDIKQSNLCCFKEDFLPDINVVSAPIFSSDGSISTVISLLGNSKETPVNATSIYVQAVQKASVEATRKIAGYSTGIGN